MAFRIIKEMSCDCCGKQFRTEHDYRMHHQETGGYALKILCSRIEHAKSEEEKLKKVFDWFLHSNPTHLKYDEELIDCAIRGMRNNFIEVESSSDNESDWYGSNFEVADFIEKSKPKIIEEFNQRIYKQMADGRKEHESQMAYLRGKIIRA